MSLIWTYFTVCQDEPKQAMCNACKSKVSRGGSTPKTYGTTNLRHHLEKKHPCLFSKYKEDTAASAKTKRDVPESQQQHPTVAPMFDTSVEKSNATTRKIMEYMALDDQPFSVVQDKGFVNLIKHLSPRYKLPSRRYFSDTALPELFEKVSSHIRKLLNATKSPISFTTDIWTSNVSLMSMLSLTAQWLDDEFELHQVLLYCEECPGSHTADNLRAKFEKMMAEWNIDKKRVHVVLRDNARNMTKALDDCNFASLPCMAHTLQLAVNEGLQSQRAITDAVATGRRIVTHFKHSPLAYSKLHVIQEELGQPKKRLQQDVPTRWNSTFYMLQSLLEQKRALSLYATEHELPTIFTTHQWELIENVLSILQPFEELTKTISSSSATASSVIPEITALKRLLGRAADTDRGVGTAKATLLEAVQRRFADIEKNPLYLVATAMDPRYKTCYFSAETKNEVKRVLLNMLDRVDTSAIRPTPDQPPEEPAIAPPTKRASLLLSVHDEILMENASNEEEHLLGRPASVQLQRYLSELPIKRSEDETVNDVLKYWRENKTHYPALAPLAQAYLSAPCTSIDSERLFSLASNVLDEKRNRLSGEKAEMLLFVKKNLPLMVE
ncbi:zinc finger BED domain-containing protein 4-like [Neoarius graeffei]|uniref:zinc finger BED domain-containing protein 4-like n=2 Tax=Neoarius graeffei TaxID=443677 RepID=UPI00298CA7AB|nr:zinc finger BED domain-containing protein 4-like [Neoarius graeffei]